MPPTLASALREQRAAVLALRIAHADVWADNDLVFPGAVGERGPGALTGLDDGEGDIVIVVGLGEDIERQVGVAAAEVDIK